MQHARDDTLLSFEQGAFAAKNIPGEHIIPMEKGRHLVLMMNTDAGARSNLLEFLGQYTVDERSRNLIKVLVCS